MVDKWRNAQRCDMMPSRADGKADKSAAVAQLVERVICNLEVVGSSPTGGFAVRHRRIP